MSEKNEQLADNEEITNNQQPVDYGDDAIQTLDWEVHIRLRPGMYIGKVGDGSAADDGIYVLLKEVIDNSIDEFMMGNGKKIEVEVTDTTVSVRDYGRGIPLGSLVKAASVMNTGAKYNSKTFKKSVGLNGVGIKAVNALSSKFVIISYREGQMRRAEFEKGKLVSDTGLLPTEEPNGTFVSFTPDGTIFQDYSYRDEYVVQQLKNYTFLNIGLVIVYNGVKMVSRDGLLDLLKENMSNEPIYPTIHLRGDDIEIAFTHCNQYGEEYYSFVNGQFTPLGGTHLTAFKESVARTLKDYYNKSFEYSDARTGIVAAISIKVEEPNFESQTKTRLGSSNMSPGGPTVQKFIGDFVKKELDNYLHRNLDVADIILKKIQRNERDRKAMSAVTKQTKDKAKKLLVYNKKLSDCTVHLSDNKGNEEKKLATSIFITEGNSAAGTITQIRDVETQAVFSLRGKPLNTYGLPLAEVYKNEEFSSLRTALNIENSLDDLRYNKVIIATDADVDGMHIRLLLMTYFLQFCPDLVKSGHVYVLQTPLFRVRDKSSTRRRDNKSKSDKKAKQDTYYCYSDQERIDVLQKLGSNAEITRFKGLGEISPDEFRGFIGPDMRVDRISLRKDDAISWLLEFYMGKNTSERQNFIIDNLVIEDDSQIS
ncbi:MAG: type IIA DNA topoisomerase subunit B [Muribaculaceae bacterium]|nr:type IIA DNA topoisomerase subunit B [Muribaculaceae bacterium]